MKKIKVVELFAGVGGFRLGLEKSSENIFQTIWANQWEPNKQKQHAFECYNKNFGSSDVHINQNISTAKFLIPNDIDLLVGGFPCQDYSVARTKANGIQGEKGVLWWEISWIIKNKQPKMILLENVDRLLKSTKGQKGKDFGIMLRDLYDNGYYVEWRVINAAEYGLQQKRKRIFIFAYKKELSLLKVKFNNINNGLSIIKDTGFFAKKFKIRNDLSINDIREIDIAKRFNDILDISESFKFDFENSGCMIGSIIYTAKTTPFYNSSFKTLNDILLKTEINENYFLNPNQVLKMMQLKDKKRIARIKPNGEHYFYSEGAMSFPDKLNIAARTMLTSEGTINRSSHVINDFKTNKRRILTPIETERINGFPDNWTNTGMPERFRYFCMGNALVVDLIKIMGDTIKEYWSNLYTTKIDQKEKENNILLQFN